MLLPLIPSHKAIESGLPTFKERVILEASPEPVEGDLFYETAIQLIFGNAKKIPSE